MHRTNKQSYKYMNFILNTTCNMNKIQIAAELLQERAERTTDATAFKVTVKQENDGRERIVLTPDYDRRGDRDSAFYHTEELAKICEVLHLQNWISAGIYYDENERPRATFEVHIY